MPGKIHTVKKGDNLNKIAAKHGFKNFEVIYKHKDNAKFRKSRPNPDEIMPGDKIAIPEPDSPAAVVDKKSVREIETVLARLKKIRTKSAADFNSLRGDVNKEYNKVKKFSNNIDLIGTLSTMGVGLGFKVKDAYKASTLAGKELAAFNKKFLKDFVVDKSLHDTQLIARAFQDDIKETSTAGLWGKRAVTVFGELFTPSFWAGAATEIAKGNFDPIKWKKCLEGIQKDALKKIGETEKNALKSLDARIAKYEAALAMAKKLAKG